MDKYDDLNDDRELPVSLRTDFFRRGGNVTIITRDKAEYRHVI
jgi:hypothetical protein